MKWQQATTRLTNENLWKKMDYIATMGEVINESKDWMGRVHCKTGIQETLKNIPYHMDNESKK
jgi:hypothetical protein